MGVYGVVCQSREFRGWERGGVRTAMAEAARASRERNLVEGMLKVAVRGVDGCEVVLGADDGEKNRGNKGGSCHLLVLELLAIL